MAIVGGIDLHRAQLTYDYLDLGSGGVTTGRIAPGDRPTLRRWLERFDGCDDVAFALKGCTGWRYVTEELQRAGIEVHVAEPAETAALSGSEAASKDRPHRRPPPARSPPPGPAAQVMDPSGGRKIASTRTTLAIKCGAQ